MQLQLTYEPAEDRLLLRMDFGDRVAAFWLTRRVAALFWPILWERVQCAQEGAVSADARPWLASLQHDRLREKQVLEQLPAFVPTTPPKLVVTLQHGAGTQGGHLLGLLDAQGEGEMLTLDDESLHAMIRLLESVAATADWHLALQKPAAMPMAAASELRH